MIELKKISDVFDVGSSKRVFKSEWTSEGVPFYRAREVVKLSKNGYVDNELFISEEMFQEYSNKYGVPKSGDILVTGVGTLGVCYQVKDHDRFYFKDGNIVWLKKRENVSSDYIEYCFKSPFVKRQIQSTADAAVVGTYTITNARNTKIPLPPLDQQKKIAAILDATDAYRQKTKALIEKYDELTQSLFLEMFGDPVTNPKGWEIKPLSDFIKSLNTGVSVNSTDKEYKNGDIGILKTSCVYTGIFRAEEAKVIREDEYERMKLNPKADSIIISRMNTSELVGKSAYISKDYNELYLPDRLWQSVKGELHHDVRWLSHAVSFQSFMNKISKISSGTSGSMKNISKKNYLNLNMIYPTPELQNQFAERVQAIESQKAQAQASLAQAEDLFNSLLQRAFKGELV